MLTLKRTTSFRHALWCAAHSRQITYARFLDRHGRVSWFLVSPSGKSVAMSAFVGLSRDELIRVLI